MARAKEFKGGINADAFKEDMFFNRVDKIHPGGKWTTRAVKPKEPNTPKTPKTPKG